LPETLDFGSLDKETRDLVVKYTSDAAIAYDFEFTIHEDNDNTTSVTLEDPLTNGMFSLDISGGNKRFRQNIRRFLVTDTFGTMFSRQNNEVCAAFPHSGEENWVYPITGSIGLAEVFHTFFRLSEYAGLTSSETGKAATLTDILTFQTTLKDLSISPEVSLTRDTDAIHLTKASGTGANERMDEHKVTLALWLQESKRPVARTLGAVSRSPTAEAMAIQELDRQRKLEFREDFLDVLRDDLGE
jgi:hypothetical protein